MTGNCKANQQSWLALISLLQGAPFMQSVTVHDIPAVYYSVVNAWLGQQGIHVGADRLVGIKALDCIEWYCLKHNLPDLTALVVHKEPRSQNRHSGDGFFESNQISVANRANLHHHWLHIAMQVVDHKAEYPVQPPPDLCRYGNCAP